MARKGGRDGRKVEPLRPTAFYDNLEKERAARGWRIRQFSEWLGLGDRLYKWTKAHKPEGLPEAETLMQIAVRLECGLDRLVRGVSAAYDAQADARRTTPTPRAIGAPAPPPVRPEEVFADPHRAVMKIVESMSEDEATAAKPMLRGG